MSTKPLAFLYAIISRTAVASCTALALFMLMPTRAGAQTPPAPGPVPAPGSVPAPPPASDEVPSEKYHVELSAGAWFTTPSTASYSDTEVVTTGTTSTTVTGTLIDFKKQLALTNRTFPGGQVSIRIVPKHKLRGEFIPLNYKQSATLASDIKISGQTYLSGQSVQSALRWNEAYIGYEFDPVTSSRGYLGGIVAVTRLNVSGALNDGVQSGTSTANVVMPGLGATGRYYPSPRFSITADFLAFDLPGGDTSTHGRSIQINGYATVNASKYFGIQGGYRWFDMNYVWGSPLNTGAMTIGGPYAGGTVRF